MLTDRTSKRLEGIRTCISNGHKVKDIYSLLTSYPDLWLLAYSNIQGNPGALTPGVTKDTVDGFSEEQVETLRKRLKEKTYRPNPVRRVEIPKANGKVRPLGIPTWEDKLTQEVARIILETLYEPLFKDTSHGFRKGWSCHTALDQVQHNWTGMKWIVEIDIKGYFDNINHEILMDLLAKRIEDKPFLKLIGLWLKAGYLEEWKYHKTYSGTPQGGIISPMLANVYLHELDEWMEHRKIAFDKGDKRKRSTKYRTIAARIARARKRLSEARTAGLEEEAKKQEQVIREEGKYFLTIPSQDQYDPNYRRLRYCRYADDFIIGIIGSKEEAVKIKEEVTKFLNDTLKLTVSEEKSRINHLSEKTRFLGYDISTWTSTRVKRTRCNGGVISLKRIAGNVGNIRLSVPKDKIAGFCQKHGIGNIQDPIHKVTARPYMYNMDDVEIMSQYNAELRGFAQYYALANTARMELHKLNWYWEVSLMKTLAGKHRSTMAKMYRKYRVNGRPAIAYAINGKPKLIKLYQVHKDLNRPRAGSPDDKPNTFGFNSRTRLIERLQATVCEYCGETQENLEVHHVRRLKDLTGKEEWQKFMIARQRKTLVVCWKCHDKIHGGKLPSRKMGTQQ